MPGASTIESSSMEQMSTRGLPQAEARGAREEIAVALLTGGGEGSYVFGLATSLASKGAALELIGSDSMDIPEFHKNARLRFLNLRGGESPDVSLARKALRILKYYGKLIRYAATAKPRIFHILWNNKFESIDRTLLMLYYKVLRKKIVLTAHNVNKASRDSRDTLLNRLTLRIQYRLTDHIFVHTEKMKRDVVENFGVQEARVTVIPFGINKAVPITRLTPNEAKRRLGIPDGEKTILFFGRITPYKGLEYLVRAFNRILSRHDDYRLIVAGRLESSHEYWAGIQEAMREGVRRGRVLLRAEFIPDEETEVYFKSADVLVLPYTSIYQSGVLFLGFRFGLPALVADVGSLKDEVVEGKTGFVFRPEDPADMAEAIERYFASDLYKNLNNRRQAIRDYVAERHSWDSVSQATMDVYAGLLRIRSREDLPNTEASGACAPNR